MPRVEPVTDKGVLPTVLTHLTGEVAHLRDIAPILTSCKWPPKNPNFIQTTNRSKESF